MSATAGPATVESIDPANGEVVATYEIFSEGQIDAALDLSHDAFGDWRRAEWSKRAELMNGVARELRAMGDEFAATVSREMGKPIAEAEAEVEKCAWAAEYYAEHGEGFLAAEPIDAGDGRRVAVHKRPLGVILAIMPWNYPLWQAMRAATPIVSAGNAFVLKHASNVTGCGLLLEQAFERAGAAPGVFKTIVVSGRKASELIGDRRIAGVTLTGSDAAGVSVGEAAGRAIKPAVLELGGSDPFIVLHDANLEKAVEVAVTARFQNTGQSCIAAKRFIVVEAVAEEFEERFAAAAKKLRRGAPMDPETQLGPMAREDLRDELAAIVRASEAAGARIVIGGEAPDEKGAWYEPTIVSATGDSQAPVMREETFGPVAAVARVADETAAIALANESEFGLGSSLWTQDLDRAERLAVDIEAGMVFVNAMTASDPRIPFGGVKRSGIGRELGGEFGMRAFVNMQSVALTEL
ncbi:MAG TPA: NAD-dependent succinate-semialdehyde dehydrogenase [Solirubrobacterales bacterium]|jgi:acyl-CoA reductase-like NAD-dependent aldehyde dehydrogenase|nr:NAD-dependent succinate-semialdehyde dehydrogenase [Solirubrobacterales bacterium]